MDLNEDKAFNSEFKRYKRLFKEIPKEKKKAAEELIKRAVFLQIQLEKYENDIYLNGAVEEFTQSDRVEPYERERPVVRIYNQAMKNYQVVMNKLLDLLPKEEAIDINPLEALEKAIQSY